MARGRHILSRAAVKIPVSASWTCPWARVQTYSSISSDIYHKNDDWPMSVGVCSHASVQNQSHPCRTIVPHRSGFWGQMSEDRRTWRNSLALRSIRNYRQLYNDYMESTRMRQDLVLSTRSCSGIRRQYQRWTYSLSIFSYTLLETPAAVKGLSDGLS